MPVAKITRKSKTRLVELFQGTAADIHTEFVKTGMERSREIHRQNNAAAGAPVDMDWMVDGIPNRALREVKPGGRMSFFYNPIQAVVNDAMEMALRWAPVGSTPLSPKYKNSFIILQDAMRGEEQVSVEVPWPGRINGIFVEIINTQPYAGVLEPHNQGRGPRVSRQAPNGIMELVAANLRAKWGTIMKINMVSKQWPSIIQGKKKEYHLPTVTISPNWRGINKSI